MADSGTCVPSQERHGDITRYRWLLTGDAGGDASVGTGSDFTTSHVWGTPIGARVINSDTSDCSDAYDVYIMDGATDIIDGEWVNLSAADGLENFALPMFEHSTVSAIIRGPIYLWDRTLQCAAADMGGVNSCIVDLYVREDWIDPGR